MKIYTDRYKDKAAVLLENEKLRLTLVPESGGKIASLIFLPDGRELLWQNPGERFQAAEYGQPFSKGEAAGFDDMFPNINECHYPDEPWKGALLPDHGELWSLPWDVLMRDDCVELEVSGVRLPYRLKKNVSLRDSTVRLGYRLENPTPFPMAFVYATHPLFNVDPGDYIRVPGGMRRVVNAVPSKRLPAYGKEYAFPEIPAGGDALIDLSTVEPKNDGYKKYYFSETSEEGWCSLCRKKAGLEIRMDYSQDILPYLGIWINEGGWGDQYNLALEPASAPMDDPVAAERWGHRSLIEADSEMEWRIDMDVLRI